MHLHNPRCRMRTVLLLAALATFPSAAWANNVGINGGACTYATVELAVLAANSGDTLYVSPGTYNENEMFVTSMTLPIKSADAACSTAVPGGVTIDAAGANRLFNLDDATLELEGLTVRGGSATNGGNVFADNGSHLILDNA